MIEISASSEVIEQLVSEEKKDIENVSRAESIKKVQQFISDKQETSLDDEKINAVNKRYSIISVIALATLITMVLASIIALFAVGILWIHVLAVGLEYEIGCLVILSVYYTLCVSKDRKQIKDAYEKTNKAVSFEMISRADEVMRALVEGKAYTIKDAEETVLSDDRKEMRKSFLNND